MFRKRNIIIVLVLIAIGGGIWYYQSRDTGEVVPTETVKRGDIVETVSVTGELVPGVYADLSFPSLGTIDEILVKDGDQVTKGMKLASLDRSVLYSQYQDALLAVRIAEENEKQVRRNRSDTATPEDVQAKKLASEQARQKVRTLKEEMQMNVLSAPIDGQVSRLSARVGEVTTAGKVLLRVMQPTTFILESRVPESDIAKIALGMKALVTFDAFTRDEIFEATVESIDPAATVVQDVVSYKVKFRLANTDSRLKEGMTGNIDIETAKREGVLWVPYRALTKEEGKIYVSVKRGETSFERVEVSTGLEGDDGTIEIKTGLKEGDEVTIGATQKK